MFSRYFQALFCPLKSRQKFPCRCHVCLSDPHHSEHLKAVQRLLLQFRGLYKHCNLWFRSNTLESLFLCSLTTYRKIDFSYIPPKKKKNPVSSAPWYHFEVFLLHLREPFGYLFHPLFSHVSIQCSGQIFHKYLGGLDWVPQTAGRTTGPGAVPESNLRCAQGECRECTQTAADMGFLGNKEILEK